MEPSSGIDRNSSGKSRTDHAIGALAARQHNRVARWQLLEIGLTGDQIDYRLAVGRLYVVARGVYAVGAVVHTPDARRMTAVLQAGEGAALAARSCLALNGIGNGW